MSKQKQKLELNWIGKEKRPRLEPRIFLEDESLSCHSGNVEQALDGNQESHQAYHDNLLIHGDNLLALKALEQDYVEKVKCIFIDPPYNTGSAFSHYDDGLEHSMWLSLLRDRLLMLQSLLTKEGSIWITIDDAEGHYLKVLCDEVFGRSNFIGQVTWQKTTSIHNNAVLFSSNTDMVLAYAKNIEHFSMGRIPRSERNTKDYKNQDNDPRGAWASSPLHVSLTSGQRGKQYALTGKSTGLYPIIGPNGQEVYPPKGRCWAYSPDSIKDFESQNLIWWGKDGNNQPRLKRFIKDNKEGVVPSTLWLSEDVGHNQEAKAENNALLPDLDKLFSTPKPERLLERIIGLSTQPGDLVLDSFAGSGTTGAVAHKMGRRWIMVELGDHCETHIVPRLKKVIDGEDQGGISKSVNWQGGGGFRYLRLAPSLLKKDEWGNWIINKEYNADMLAAAMCKHMGFTYAPSDTQFWNQGFSTETDFIYTTTGSLAYDQLKRISDEVGSERTLLICCKAFMSEGTDFPNLTIKKIPQAILNKCEWDNDDYSFTLNVLADPTEDFEEEDMDD